LLQFEPVSCAKLVEILSLVMYIFGLIIVVDEFLDMESVLVVWKCNGGGGAKLSFNIRSSLLSDTKI